MINNKDFTRRIAGLLQSISCTLKPVIYLIQCTLVYIAHTNAAQGANAGWFSLFSKHKLCRE